MLWLVYKLKNHDANVVYHNTDKYYHIEDKLVHSEVDDVDYKRDKLYDDIRFHMELVTSCITE